ncbi:MAG: TetR family transcriptional regulator [Synergistaceae bacterium]|nr:TetR family transcriptional regulator [Synergistaceae bacterium]
MARRTKEEARETRERLLEAAFEIMSEKPFSSVSMSEIAKRVGLSKGATYWHFKNKTDILLNVIESVCMQSSYEMLGGIREGGSVNDVREYFKAKISGANRSKRIQMISRLMNRKNEWPDEVRKKLPDMFIEFAKSESEMVKGSLQKLREEGRIMTGISVDDLSVLITAIFHGLFIFQVLQLYDMDFSKYTDFVFDAFENAVKER